MKRNGLIIDQKKWTGKYCPKCGSEMFQSNNYLHCSKHSCSYGEKKEK